MTEKRIEDIEKEHLGEWLVIEVRSENKRRDPLTDVLLAHSPNKQDIIETAKTAKGDIYVTFVIDPSKPQPVWIL